MKLFLITARHASGKTVTRYIKAVSQEAASQLMKSQNWQVLTLEESKKETLFWKRKRPFQAGELGRFFQELAEMTCSGIPFVDSWRLLLADRPRMKNEAVLRWILEEMENGSSPSSLLKASGLFPPLACHVLRAGESSGNLEMMLAALGNYYLAAEQQKKQLLQAFVYPAFLLVCAAAVLVGAVLFILPVFETMFQEMQLPLPPLTRSLLTAKQFIYQQPAFLPCFISLAGLALYSLQRQGRIRAWAVARLMELPGIRRFLLIWCWQRFSAILAVQLKGGIPLLQAVHDAALVVSLAWFRRKITACAREIRAGYTFSAAVKHGGFGTPYVETMLSIGEATGNYDAAFMKISAHYEWQLHLWLVNLRKLAEPLIMVLVGTVIGILVLALLLPLLDAANGIF